MSDFKYEKYEEVKDNFQGVGLMLTDNDIKMFNKATDDLNQSIRDFSPDLTPDSPVWQKHNEAYAIRQELLENGVINKSKGEIVYEGLENDDAERDEL